MVRKERDGSNALNRLLKSQSVKTEESGSDLYHVISEARFLRHHHSVPGAVLRSTLESQALCCMFVKITKLPKKTAVTYAYARGPFHYPRKAKQSAHRQSHLRQI